MNADDAIFAGFADSYIPQSKWITLIEALEGSGDPDVIAAQAETPEHGPLRQQLDEINALFSGEDLNDILTDLRQFDSDFSIAALKKISRGSPLSMASTIEMIHRLRGPSLSMEKSLDLEFRFTARSMQHADFLEGIRAAIIEKDRNPNWQYADMNVPLSAVSQMLRPLGAEALKL
jgi:enoyl-CoA hydratase